MSVLLSLEWDSKSTTIERTEPTSRAEFYSGQLPGSAAGKLRRVRSTHGRRHGERERERGLLSRALSRSQAASPYKVQISPRLVDLEFVTKYSVPDANQGQ